jgi:hypothetical protein
MKTKKYQVTFTLEVEDDDSAEVVEEAVTAIIDEEIRGHEEGGTRCGVRFHDAAMFEVTSA